MSNSALYAWGMTDRKPARKGGRPRSDARKDWVDFLLRMPPDMRAEVQRIADRDVLAPSVNTVLLQLIGEALAARASRKR